MSEGTAVEPAGSHLPATASEMGLDSGLEDFETTDMVMPRLSINHTEAVLEDNLTGEKHEKLLVVMLGLVKQRILWAPEVQDGEGPLCKSFDFRNGHPDGKNFPWDASGFDKADTQDDGSLPCSACHLKEWGSNPKSEAPWCSEQHTFPLLMQTADGTFEAPAIFTVQRSAIKPSKQYLTGFARSKTPTYTVVTELGLTPQKRGSVHYAVPVFKKVGETERDDWPEFAEHYRTIREFITTPPAREDEPETTTVAPSTTPGRSEAAAAATSDDDLPF